MRRVGRWTRECRPQPGEPGPVPIGHLSYSALALYEHCGYRFYVERVLGARESLVRPFADGDVPLNLLADLCAENREVKLPPSG